MESIITKLSKEAKKINLKYKHQIEDIILFGSFMKGKDKVQDIDILMLFKEKIDKTAEVELRNKLKEDILDINSITVSEFNSKGFIAKEGIYLEGFSLIRKEKISSKIGFASMAFVNYNISNTKGSDRVRFYYALHGRNSNTGFLHRFNIKRYSDNVLICNYNSIEKVKAFLDDWNIEYDVVPSLVPERLEKVLMR